jgi:predicted secreted Zn-dependent protease
LQTRLRATKLNWERQQQEQEQSCVVKERKEKGEFQFVHFFPSLPGNVFVISLPEVVSNWLQCVKVDNNQQKPIGPNLTWPFYA